MKNWYATIWVNGPLYFMLSIFGTAAATAMAYFNNANPFAILVAAFCGGFAFAHCMLRQMGVKLSQAAINNAISFDKWNEKNADAPK